MIFYKYWMCAACRNVNKTIHQREGFHPRISLCWLLLGGLRWCIGVQEIWVLQFFQVFGRRQDVGGTCRRPTPLLKINAECQLQNCDEREQSTVKKMHAWLIVPCQKVYNILQLFRSTVKVCRDGKECYALCLICCLGNGQLPKRQTLGEFVLRFFFSINWEIWFIYRYLYFICRFNEICLS